MIVLNFSFNNDTYNTEIDLLDQIDLSKVEFNLEQDGVLFEYEEGFVKDCDGQTELFLD